MNKPLENKSGPTVIETLENVLRDARSGEVVALIGVVVTADGRRGEVRCSVDPGVDADLVVAGLTRLTYRLLRETTTDAEAAADSGPHESNET